MGISTRTFLIATLAIVLGLYKTYVHHAIVLLPGFGRVTQPLEDFPDYRCRQVKHPLLDSCEDLYLDYTDRKLYAACSNSEARSAWSPGGSAYDLAGRAKAGGGTGYLTVLDIDGPESAGDGAFNARAINFLGKDGAKQEVDLHGLDARRIGNTMRFWLVNHRPPVDLATGKVLEDATDVGANSTIEVYDLDLTQSPQAQSLIHVKTIASDAIISPNNLVIIDDDGSFLFTNDHSSKVGTFRPLTPLLGGGSVGHCRTDTGECHLALTEKCIIPNGITRDPVTGLVYVAQAGKGAMAVYRLNDAGRLEQVDEVYLGMMFDNLTIDPEGNIFAGGFPDPQGLMRAFRNPYGTSAPSTIFMMRKVTGENGKETYEVVKLVEDAEAKVLPTTSTAVHDSVTGRLFLGGVVSKFLGVCECLSDIDTMRLVLAS